MSEDKIILINFYGDIGYSYNLPEVLSYPKNLSYSRPFRYNEKWVSDDLKRDLEEGIENYRNRRGLLCMKLSDGKIIAPIWEIFIDYIEIVDNHYLFYFRTSNLISHIENENIEEYSILFKKTKNLAEYASNEIFNNLKIGENDDTWIDIVEKIVKADNVSLQSFKKTFFYRIIKISHEKNKKSEEIKPQYIEHKKQWAYQFSPKKNYEIEIFHKILLDSENEKLREFYNLKLTGPFYANTSNLVSEINSNYSIHNFSLQTIVDKYAGKTISVNCDQLMKYYKVGIPNESFDVNFRSVKFPAYLKISKSSIFFNKILPYLGFLFGSGFLISAIYNDSVLLSSIGTIIQTLSLISIPRRR